MDNYGGGGSKIGNFYENKKRPNQLRLTTQRLITTKQTKPRVKELSMKNIGVKVLGGGG